MSTTTAPRTGALADLTPGVWTVDPSHSTVGFTARHLMITKVHGHFTDFDGIVTIADDPLASSVVANVRLDSVDTGSADRDAHLRTADFFDVEQHPEMTPAIDGDHRGPRRLPARRRPDASRGQTHPVEFALEFDGVSTDPFGNTKAGLLGRDRDQPQRLGPELQHGPRDRRRGRVREDPDRARHPARPQLTPSVRRPRRPHPDPRTVRRRHPVAGPSASGRRSLPRQEHQRRTTGRARGRRRCPRCR